MTDLELIEEAARSISRQTHGVVSFAFSQFARNIHNMNKERTKKTNTPIHDKLLKDNPLKSKLHMKSKGNTK